MTMEQGMSVSKHAAHLDCSVAFAAESAGLFCSEGHISSLQDGSLCEPLARCEPLPQLDGESNGCCRRSRRCHYAFDRSTKCQHRQPWTCCKDDRTM